MNWVIDQQKLKAIEELKEQQASGKTLQKNQVSHPVAQIRWMIQERKDYGGMLEKIHNGERMMEMRQNDGGMIEEGL